MPITAIRGGRQITDATIPYADLQSATQGNVVLGNALGTGAPLTEIQIASNSLLGRTSGNITNVTLGANGGLEFSGTNLQTTANLRSLHGLTFASTAFVKMTGANTFTLDTNTYLTSAGGGVTKVGTPVDNQVAVWTGDGTIEGDTAFTFNTTSDIATIGVVDIGKFPSSAATILRYTGLTDTAYALSQDSSGSTYLNAATGQLIRFTINNNGAGSAHFTQSGFHLGDIANTSPARRFHITKEASDNSVNYGMRLTQQTTATPASGLGIGIEFEVETAATPNFEIGATIEALVTDVTSTSEDFDLIFKTMATGTTAAERLRIISTGQLKLSNYTSTSSFTGTPVGYLQFDSSGNIITAALPSGGGIGGSTGSVDNAVLRADGTGGSTVQNSPVIISDTGDLQLGTTAVANASKTISVESSAADASLVVKSKGASSVLVQGGNTGVVSSELRVTSSGIRGVYKTNATNTIQTGLQSVHETTATPAVGIGTAFELVTQTTAGGALFVGSSLESVSTNITSGQETFDTIIFNFNLGTEAEKLRVKSTGTLVLPFGQIEFPATQNASSNVNTLDDYEEGDWTPTYVASSGAFTTLTYGTARGGKYQKIGNRVYISGILTTNSVTLGTATGDLYIGGLPITMASSTTAEAAMVMFPRVLTWATDPPASAYALNTTQLTMYRQRDLTTDENTATINPQDMTTGAVTAANLAWFFGWYNATS